MIRIILVDDHAIVRTGYRRLLDAEPGMMVVGEAASADEANALALRVQADVALTDLSLKGSSGIEAIRGMLARNPALKILVLSMHEGAGHALQALRSGALGYLTKHAEPDAVIDGIRRVATGKKVLSPGIAETLACDAVDGDKIMASLTPREFEVLRLFAQGESTGNIATFLHLSPKTILNYLSLIRQKLETESDVQLLQFAEKHGLVASAKQESTT